MTRALLCLLLLALASAPQAKEAQPMAEDPVIEAQLLDISKELRCLVCQNETLADSRADLAKDLRREVREQISQGKTNAQIKAYLVQRYGNFVLYRPPVNSVTGILWFGPFLLLLVAAISVGLFIKRRRRTLEDTPLSPDEIARIQSLLPNESKNA